MLRIERTRNGEGRIFRLIGALDGGSTRQLERVVSGPAGDGGDVTLDLAELAECDQAGVDSLTVLARRRRVAGGRLLFCSAARRSGSRWSKGTWRCRSIPERERAADHRDRRLSRKLGSDDANVLRLDALPALSGVELDPLTFLQRLVASGLDRGEVNEHVITLLLRDEAEAFVGVEELDRTLCHQCSFLIATSRRFRPARNTHRTGSRPDATTDPKISRGWPRRGSRARSSHFG